MTKKPVLAIPLLLVPFLGGSVAPCADEPAPRPFLRKVIQLDDVQLAALEKGEVVTKLLPTTEKAEIAAFGVVRSPGTPELLLRRARDVQGFRQVPRSPRWGCLSPSSPTSRGCTILPTTSLPSRSASREAAT